MGKATRWLKGLLGIKKEREYCGYSDSLAPDKREKKQPGKDGESHITPSSIDHTRHRFYVAKKDGVKNKQATDVAVERSRRYHRQTLLIGSKEGWAAVSIQSFFRGYLARKALRALKGLVKIQALVRGYLVRKRVAATLHSVQAMIRAQAVARSVRARRSMDKENRFHPQSPSRKYVQQQFDETRNYQCRNRRAPLNGFDQRSKVVEVDTRMAHSRSRSINTAMSECGEELQYQAMSSSLPCAVQRRISLHERQHPEEFEWFFNLGESNKFSTAHNTPRLPKCMIPATPLRSVCGDTFRPCSNFPNYMANTHSSKAKLRSHSAPKQRPEQRKRLSINEIMAARNSVSGVGKHWSSNPKTQDYYFFDKVL